MGKVSYNLKRNWCNLPFFKLHFVENSIYKKILIDSLVRAFFGKNKYYASYREEYIYIYSECSKSPNKCYHFKHAKDGYKTRLQFCSLC